MSNDGSKGRMFGVATRVIWVLPFALFFIALYMFLPYSLDVTVSKVNIEHIGSHESGTSITTDEPIWSSKTTPQPKGWEIATLNNTKSKLAFATFLAGELDDADEEAEIVNDHYFTAIRILTYQLLHANDTRSVDRDIPFIVLVTSHVSEARKKRLRQDGAIVYEAEFVETPYINIETKNWRDVMTKLRLWELEQFDRICFLDGDTVLAKPLDGVFQDPAVASRKSLGVESATFDDEAPIPETYVFAGMTEVWQNHSFPPVYENNTDVPNTWYLNAGFFVIEPRRPILDYYLDFLSKNQTKFATQLPEQNLLNYAHRQWGNMPWQHLDSIWNIHYPLPNDIKGGVKSLHDKWWAPEHPNIPELNDFYMEKRWRMEGFFEARDLLLGQGVDTSRWSDH